MLACGDVTDREIFHIDLITCGVETCLITEHDVRTKGIPFTVHGIIVHGHGSNSRRTSKVKLPLPVLNNCGGLPGIWLVAVNEYLPLSEISTLLIMRLGYPNILLESFCSGPSLCHWKVVGKGKAGDASKLTSRFCRPLINRTGLVKF